MGGSLKHGFARHRSSGTTLLELIIVIGLIGILMAIGVPSYKYVTSANRATAEVNSLFGDMQYARAEAVRQGMNIVVCVSTDGQTCVGNSIAWHQGWIICSDPLATNNCANSATQPQWRHQKAFTSTDTFNADNNASQIVFNREGFALLPAKVTIKLHDATASPNFTRCLQIDRPGTLSTELTGVGNCS
jgi:type IV fimbrial biogenesis protein FimT